MPRPTKTAITGLSAAALVAAVGFAYAQSSDDSALANSNFNGAQNSADTTLNGPPAMPPEAAAAVPGGSETAGSVETSEQSGSPYGSPAPSDERPTTAAPAAPAEEALPPDAAADTSDAGSTTTATDPNATNPSTTSSPGTAPATSADTTTSASEPTRIELNSPNEEQYNLASDPWLRGGGTGYVQNPDAPTGGSVSAPSDTGGDTGDTRAPRADRH